MPPHWTVSTSMKMPSYRRWRNILRSAPLTPCNSNTVVLKGEAPSGPAAASSDPAPAEPPSSTSRSRPSPATPVARVTAKNRRQGRPP
eukprot:CAMPEP_0175605022 /NCGR_PEP_ID=MMETSP0096-20121207/59983_1 /TAXON_ID=311494 /ORGANISM="Alexandrium monilatum, Strain CCMP3105" /LENGTH=87 /DNA_ID=CAMNT_0016909803 /DNA_START=314 /DNA_END=574 /DNA_ORIENTATION=+